MKVLTNNRDLYEYLLLLTSILKQRGAADLSNAVKFATGNAASSSTEFLGESRIALRRVSTDAKGVLTDQELSDLLDVLKQLDKAFQKR
jgi:hypothetical protein